MSIKRSICHYWSRLGKGPVIHMLLYIRVGKGRPLEHTR